MYKHFHGDQPNAATQTDRLTPDSRQTPRMLERRSGPVERGGYCRSHSAPAHFVRRPVTRHKHIRAGSGVHHAADLF
jgi:hypothetical protein